MNQGPEAAYKNYTAYDQHYEKVGKVDDLFVDENDQPEYIGVKMGLLGTKSTLIPIELVRVNERRHLVEIAADEETIKHAPTFHDDKDITPEYEHGVYGYFGLQPPASEPQRTSYGGYYASESYADEDLQRSVDTEYGERAERTAGTTPSGGSGQTNLDVPLDEPGRGGPAVQPPRRGTTGDPFDADAATRTGGETRTGGDQPDEVRVEGDREIRVFKRTRSATR